MNSEHNNTQTKYYLQTERLKVFTQDTLDRMEGSQRMINTLRAVIESIKQEVLEIERQCRENEVIDASMFERNNINNY